MDNYRVLFVDDEEELVAALVERLGYRGIDAEYVTDGRLVEGKLRDSQFDVVVLDLKLPGMSGAQVLRNLNAEHPNLPVLMITGHGSALDEPEDRPEGAYDYLAKPISIDALMEKMREAIQASSGETNA